MVFGINAFRNKISASGTVIASLRPIAHWLPSMDSNTVYFIQNPYYIEIYNGDVRDEFCLNNIQEFDCSTNLYM